MKLEDFQRAFGSSGPTPEGGPKGSILLTVIITVVVISVIVIIVHDVKKHQKPKTKDQDHI